MSQFRFAGAGAVVTGAGSGLGRSIAFEFASRGASVIVADIDDAAATKVADDISATGGTAYPHQVDVTDIQAVGALAAYAADRLGSVNVVVNNAGVTWRPFRALWNASLSDIRWMTEVNFFGVVHGVLAFLPYLRAASGRAHIVNTSSFATLAVTPGHAPYTASKHAVDGLSDVLRAELEDHGHDIGVTVLYPGLIQTNIAETSRAVRQVQTSEDLGGAEPYEQVRDFSHRRHVIGKGPDGVGWQVAEAILHNDPYCLTHPADEDELDARTAHVLAGYRDR